MENEHHACGDYRYLTLGSANVQTARASIKQ